MKDYIKEKILNQGYSSLYQFCRTHNLDYHRVWETLRFLRVSRPLILKIAKILNSPELLLYYEEELQKRKQKPKTGGGACET